jgi:hypothetical protein
MCSNHEYVTDRARAFQDVWIFSRSIQCTAAAQPAAFSKNILKPLFRIASFRISYFHSRTIRCTFPPHLAAPLHTAPQAAAAAAAAATTNKQTAMMALVKGPTPKHSLVTHQHAPSRGLSWAASVRLGCTLVRRRTHSPALFEVALDRSRLCHLHLPTRSHPHRVPLRLAAVTAAAWERAHRHARSFKGAITHPPRTV